MAFSVLNFEAPNGRIFQLNYTDAVPANPVPRSRWGLTEATSLAAGELESWIVQVPSHITELSCIPIEIYIRKNVTNDTTI